MLYQFHITKRNSKLLLNSPSQQKQMLKTYFKFTPVCSWTIRAHSVSIQRQVCSYKKGALQNCCISRQRNPKELPSKRFKEFPWKAQWHHFSWVHWVFSNKRKQQEYACYGLALGQLRQHMWNVCHQLWLYGSLRKFWSRLGRFLRGSRVIACRCKRFDARASNKSDTGSSMLSYYSQIPIEWIDILGRLFRANFEMFDYDFPGPLKSLFEQEKRAWLCQFIS